MFSGAKSFNQDLSKWNVAKIPDMQGMFSQASAFNGGLSKWNVGKIPDMNWMFSQASSFDQDLSKWNVGKVTNMDMMFHEATSFDQVLCGPTWVNLEASKKSMFDESHGSISCDHFQPQNREELEAAVDSCRGGCCSLM